MIYLDRKGKRFTMLEMLIVMAIIVLLAGLLFPTINVITKKIKNMQALSKAKTLKQAIDTYASTYSRKPFYKFTSNTNYSSLTYESAPPNLAKSNLTHDANDLSRDFLLPVPTEYCTDYLKNPPNNTINFGWIPKYKDDYSKKSYSNHPTISFSDTEYYDRLIKILAVAANKDLIKKYNPKKIVFLDGIDAEGHYFDPWGHRMGLGADLDGTTNLNPFPRYVPYHKSRDTSLHNYRRGRNLSQTFIVWSFGENGINECGLDESKGINADTGEKFDDITSWTD